MASLPATDLWDKSKINNRMAYLKLCADREDLSPHSRVHALTQVAELMLARDQDISDCRKYLELAFGMLSRLPDLEFLPTPTALFGAALQVATVGVHADRLTIKYGPSSRDFSWTAPTPLLATGIGALLAAALASNVADSAVPALLGELPVVNSGRKLEKNARDELWQKRRVMLLAANAPEAGILPAFGLLRNDKGMFDSGKPDPDAAWPTLVAREEQYAARIRLSQQDVRWFGINPSAPLIDWPLLCLELALQRNTKTSLPPTKDLSAKFIRELAKKFQ